MTNVNAPRRAVGALLLLAATQCSPVLARGRPEAGSGCTVRASAPQPITLRNGAGVTIDVSSMVRNGGRVLIAGTPTHEWAPDARAGDGPVGAAGAFGVIRDAAGRHNLVPPPPGVADAKHPRAASAGAGGWHVLFVTGSRGTGASLLAFPSAEIWYGRYDGRAWHDVTRITRVLEAALLPEMSSRLVVTRTGLAFAYAFDQSSVRRSNAHGNQGLVLLHRHGAHWRADTLNTWEAARAIQLTTDSSGTVFAAYAQSYFARQRPHGPALFTARYDTAWTRPQLALDTPPLDLATPMLPPSIGAGSPIAWSATVPGTYSTTLIWGVLARDGVIQPMRRVASIRGVDRPAMLVVDAARTAWLVRDGESRTALRVLVAGRDTVQDLGVIPVPLDNFATHAVALSDATFLIATGGLGRTPSDPPASSYLTEVTVRCQGARPSGRAAQVPSTR